MSIKHFNVNIRQNKDGLKLTRENYAIVNRKCTTLDNIDNYYETCGGNDKREQFLKIFEDESASYYTETWCEEHLEKALKNYDMNIRFFNSLDKEEFSNAVNSFILKNGDFKEIFDLYSVDKISGYYAIVIDTYCQIYIGTANNIKQRIMSHWSKKKQFDRLIFGSLENSKLSIDSFRALDTTRIFAFSTNEIYLHEDNFINDIPSKFMCNRTGGGIPEFGVISILANAKYRNFTD